MRVWQDGVAALERTYHAPRLTDVDLLTMALEAGGRDAIAEGTLAMAARLIGSGAAGTGGPETG